MIFTIACLLMNTASVGNCSSTKSIGASAENWMSCDMVVPLGILNSVFSCCRFLDSIFVIFKATIIGGEVRFERQYVARDWSMLVGVDSHTGYQVHASRRPLKKGSGGGTLGKIPGALFLCFAHLIFHQMWRCFCLTLPVWKAIVRGLSKALTPQTWQLLCSCMLKEFRLLLSCFLLHS